MTIKERTNQVKAHLKQHKSVYITGGVCLIIGATGATAVFAKKGQIVVNPKIVQVLNWKPQASLEVFIEALGDPGNIIQDTATGTIYASQGQAAKALGVTAPTVSQHLAGKTSHVKGHVLEKLGKAMVADAAA